MWSLNGRLPQYGILKHYQAQAQDETTRVVSIGTSFTRKVLSSVRAYGEHRDLVNFPLAGCGQQAGVLRHQLYTGRLEGTVGFFPV